MIRKRVERYLRQLHMIQPGDRVTVGLSGGADSVLLLLLLSELREVLSFTLRAVHVNHGIRGEESDSDEAFVRELCRSLKVELVVHREAVPDLAEKWHLGLEEAARKVRRQIWQKCFDEGADKIALAHHKNDVAETLLFHGARGSSLQGLSSIRPVNGYLIRPLLCLTREEIRQELKRRNLSWREDSSNRDTVYSRNCIRHRVIPVLEGEINARAVQHLADAAEDLAEAHDYFTARSMELLQQLGEERENGFFLPSEILEQPQILLGYVLKQLLERVAGHSKDLTREHVFALADLLEGQTGRRRDLPYGIEARKTYGGILIKKRSASGPAPIRDGAEKRNDALCDMEAAAGPDGTALFLREDTLRAAEGPILLPELTPGERCRISLAEGNLELELLQEKPPFVPEKRYTKWLDYDRIKNGLVLRRRKPGDVLVVDSEGNHKKLKNYLVDQKIPAEERSRLWILASENRVFWVIGHRISADAKITGETGQVLLVQWVPAGV